MNTVQVSVSWGIRLLSNALNVPTPLLVRRPSRSLEPGQGVPMVDPSGFLPPIVFFWGGVLRVCGREAALST
jgi:hypothetical protein